MMPKDPSTSKIVSPSTERPSFTRVCPDVASTEQLGEQLASRAKPGEVFALYGDLGAGKTAFARGFIRHFMPRVRVHSPTFNLLHTHHSATATLHHIDLYRLESIAEIHSAGLTDYLPDLEGITLVEWAERWIPLPGQIPAQQPPWLTMITFDIIDEATRRLHVNPVRPTDIV